MRDAFAWWGIWLATVATGFVLWVALLLALAPDFLTCP